MTTTAPKYERERAPSPGDGAEMSAEGHYIFRWGRQEMSTDEPWLFDRLVDVRRLPPEIDLSEATRFKLPVPVVPVAVQLSTLALESWMDIVAFPILKALAPMAEQHHGRTLTAEKPHGTRREFCRVEFDWNDPAALEAIDYTRDSGTLTWHWHV